MAFADYRPRIVLTVAALLFVFVAVYRFNTLGGALGGFDNDHFLHFILAKQVQAGEQPLRDFLDLGMQGARPSLTYELSALAQQIGGNTLRSEALLTVLGVAAGAAVTMLAASHLAPWPIALPLTVLSVLTSPKLYGYPKVVVLATAAYLIARHAVQPAWTWIAAMAACAAAAFLFRHDYAVYCAIGFVTVIAASAQWPVGRRIGGVAALGALTGALLAPSLWWVEQYVGLQAYVQNALEMSRREAQRTDLPWPVLTWPGFDSIGQVFEQEANAEAWLYYLFLLTPVLGVLLAVAALRRGGSRVEGTPAALLALSLMTFALAVFFLRGSLEARFGDLAAPLAVLAAGLAAIPIEPSFRGAAQRVLGGTVALALLAPTALAIWSLQSVRTELDRSGLSRSPLAVARQGQRVFAEMGRLPAGLRGGDASPSGRAAAYLRVCTGEGDRVMVVGYAPEVIALSERPFAGGRSIFLPGFYEHERYGLYLLDRLARQSVPLILAETEPYYAAFPRLPDHLRSKYVEAGTIPIDGGVQLRILARRGPSRGAYGPGKWPCFAPASMP